MEFQASFDNKSWVDAKPGGIVWAYAKYFRIKEEVPSLNLSTSESAAILAVPPKPQGVLTSTAIEVSTAVECNHTWIMYQPFIGQPFECCSKCPMTKEQFNKVSKPEQLPLGWANLSLEEKIIKAATDLAFTSGLNATICFVSTNTFNKLEQSLGARRFVTSHALYGLGLQLFSPTGNLSVYPRENVTDDVFILN